MLNTNLAALYHGIRIIQDKTLVDIRHKTVNRPWKERLFSWPFQPFKKTKIITIRVPKKEIYESNINGQKLWIVHPIFWKVIEYFIENPQAKIGKPFLEPNSGKPGEQQNDGPGYSMIYLDPLAGLKWKNNTMPWKLS